MKRPCLLIAIAAAVFFPALSQKKSPFSGRWDLTVTTPKESYPSWIEFEPNDKVRLVSKVASVHAVQPKVQGNRMEFDSQEWFGKQIKVDWEFTMTNGKLTGHQKRADGVEGEITGIPAPPLKRAQPKGWGKAEPLFNGKDLTGWEPDEPNQNHWRAIEGELVNQAAGANIRSTRKLDDFKLHIEYNCPDKGNSGIYLRGRYEVQVEYEPVGTDDALHSMGAIYGFIAPAKTLPRKPGQWESFDVTLVGRTVTVVRNGVTTISQREIPGVTGGALDSNEAEPAPIYIQGDHTGGMKYRNITVQVPVH
jgi:hypothetical protein